MELQNADQAENIDAASWLRGLEKQDLKTDCMKTQRSYKQKLKKKKDVGRGKRLLTHSYTKYLLLAASYVLKVATSLMSRLGPFVS